MKQPPKPRKVTITKRFYSDDLEKWQAAANKETRGNLTRWIEKVLNERVGIIDQFNNKSIAKALTMISVANQMFENENI